MPQLPPWTRSTLLSQVVFTRRGSFGPATSAAPLAVTVESVKRTPYPPQFVRVFGPIAWASFERNHGVPEANRSVKVVEPSFGSRNVSASSRRPFARSWTT